MGACLAHCLTNVTDYFSHRSYSRHTNAYYTNGEEQAEVNQDISFNNDQDNCNQFKSSRLLSLFSGKKLKNHKVPVTLELAEDTGWLGRSNKYSKLGSTNASTSSGLDNPLQTLDAKGLLMHQGIISSASASSLDLEWEHEGISIHTEKNKKLDSPDGSLSEASVQNNSQISNITASPWSRASTPNSLEWDPVEADMMDIETEKLLSEIEELTDRALKETGEWTTSS